MTDKEFDQLLTNHIIVIYDGECGFCNSILQFILKQKPSQKLRFVSFQSTLGFKIRQSLKINENLDSIIVVKDKIYYKKSEAAFIILNYIHSNWKYLKYLSFIPTAISNYFYDIIANNRYRIQKDNCTIPSPEEREFFI